MEKCIQRFWLGICKASKRIMKKIILNKVIYKRVRFLIENSGFRMELTNTDEFEERLMELVSTWQEDSPVIPSANTRGDFHNIGSTDLNGERVFIAIKDKKSISIGPFEIFLRTAEGKTIGYFRGLKRNAGFIQFSMSYIVPEHRRNGLAFEVYSFLIDKGYTIVSDNELSDEIAGLYLDLAEYYTPLVVDYKGSELVGLKK